MRKMAPISAVRGAYTIPTDAPEADWTMAWDSTTLVIAEIEGGGAQGLGYTYTDAAASKLIDGKLAEASSASSRGA